MYDKKMILVVQNQIEQLQLWKSGFFSQDCQVFVSPSQEAIILRMLSDLSIDLLLLDLNIRNFNPYIFCRNILKNNRKLQIVLTDYKRQKISDLEWQWTFSQGAQDIVLGLSNSSQLSVILEKLFENLGWSELYNEQAVEHFLATTELGQKIIHQPIIESIFGEELVIDRVFARNLCHAMYSSQDLEIKDRRWRLRIFKKCFIGQEAVNWLSKYLQIQRDEAIVIGQKLLEEGHIFHVLKEHDFQDGYFFYRFSMDGFPSQRIFSST
ncbi:MAG: hypothetical protein ACFBSE_25005 [Prochloraceae cyanobacterium]